MSSAYYTDDLLIIFAMFRPSSKRFPFNLRMAFLQASRNFLERGRDCLTLFLAPETTRSTMTKTPTPQVTVTGRTHNLSKRGLKRPPRIGQQRTVLTITNGIFFPLVATSFPISSAYFMPSKIFTSAKSEEKCWPPRVHDTVFAFTGYDVLSREFRKR